MENLRFPGDGSGGSAGHGPDAHFSDPDRTHWQDDPLDLSGQTGKAESEEVSAAPPPAIGQDERRMQVRAYNFWAGLLGEEDFPEAHRLDPANDPDLGPYSVLLDLSADPSNPRILHLGKLLAQGCECDTIERIETLSDVPGNSMLTRITEHYSALLSSRSPIGFEAEFFSGPGVTVMYRGILLPFSRDGRTIDHIYGVLNWKDMVDSKTSDQIVQGAEAALQCCDERDAPWVETVAAPVADRLRTINPVGFEELADDGPEFTLLMARRMRSGNVLLLGEVPFDAALIGVAENRMTKGDARSSGAGVQG